MEKYDILFLVPREQAEGIYKDKPDSIDVLVWKSQNWIDYTIFGLNILQHLEWLYQTYLSLRKVKYTGKEIKIIRYDDRTELNLNNYSLDEITPELITSLFNQLGNDTSKNQSP
ncbi:hypothetical protein CVV65_13550 [Kyrpidia spormannii]|uniref:Uncharacterized protein n=1 Tax=Kyrpidia spormannii TaxID=2055160 RepID=A0A2K8N924_9BACL|nr:hypothetical protein [Kyrpidia spormannii]ATY85824.1 hypothetical protein CVV65_13550 [Kyrpidia spormannii]